MVCPQNKKIMSVQTNVRNRSVQLQTQVSCSALMVGKLSGLPDMIEIEGICLKGIHPKYRSKINGWIPLTEQEEKEWRERVRKESSQKKQEILKLVPKLMKWVEFHRQKKSLEPFKFMLEFTKDACTPDEICIFRSDYDKLKEDYKQELREGKMRKDLLNYTDKWFVQFEEYYGSDQLNTYFGKYGNIYVPHKKLKRMKSRFPAPFRFQPLNPHCKQNQQGLYENCRFPNSYFQKWFQAVESGQVQKSLEDDESIVSKNDLDQVSKDDESIVSNLNLELETQIQRSIDEVQTEVVRERQRDDQKVDGLTQEEAHNMERQMIIKQLSSSNGGLKNGDMQQKEMNQKRKMSLSLSPKKEVEEEERDEKKRHVEEKKDEEKQKRKQQVEEIYQRNINELLLQNQNKDKPKVGDDAKRRSPPKPTVGDLLMLTGDLRDKAAPENAEKTINAQYPYALVHAVYEDSVELTSSDMNASKKSQENLEKERRDAEEKVIWHINMNSDEDLNIFKKYFKTVSSLAERKDRWYNEVEEEKSRKRLRKKEIEVQGVSEME